MSRFLRLSIVLALVVLSGCGFVRVIQPSPEFTPGQLVALPKNILEQPDNMDFEKVDDKGFPDGWQLIGRAKVSTDEKTVRSGERALRMLQGHSSEISQCIEAQGYASRKALLAGDLKSDEEARVNLRLRAVHPSKRGYSAVGRDRSSFFANRNAATRSSNSSSGTSWWARYRVQIEVPEDAALICYSVVFRGPGTGWVDALSLEVKE